MKKKLIIIISVILVILLIIIGAIALKNNKKEENNTKNEVTNSAELKGLPEYKDTKPTGFIRYSGAIDVKLSYPATWVSASQNTQQPVFISKDETDAKINIITALNDKPLEQLVEASVANLKNSGTVKGDISQQMINLNGRKACRIDYIMTQKSGQATGNTLRR